MKYLNDSSVFSDFVVLAKIHGRHKESYSVIFSFISSIASWLSYFIPQL